MFYIISKLFNPVQIFLKSGDIVLEFSLLIKLIHSQAQLFFLYLIFVKMVLYKSIFMFGCNMMFKN